MRKTAIACHAVLAGFFAACRPDAGASLARPVIDTLPGGALAVHSPGPTGWNDTTGWRLVPDGRIGGALGEPGELVNPRDLALDGAGRLYVSDQQPAVIKVFGPDGRFIRTIGREGQGPGEFIIAFIAARGAWLAVQDPRTARLTLFDTAGTFVRSWSSGCCVWAQMAFDRENRIYVPAMTPPETKAAAAYARYDTLGAAVDTVWVPEGPEMKMWTVNAGSGGNRMMMMMPVPFTPRMIHGITPEGALVFGWSGAYRLARTDGHGDTLAILSRDWTAEPLAGERKAATIERMIREQGPEMDEALLRRSFPVGEISDALPAFEAIHVDGRGNLWLVTDSDSTYARLDVFSPDGAWLGRVALPEPLRPYSPIVWGEDRLYVAREDDEGVPYIARYRIERS